MEKNRVCKICNRRFVNGKAMGGHMRSHLAKLPIPAKPHKSPSSSSSLTNPLSKNNMQSYRSVNRELACNLTKPDLDRESETESPRNPTKRRSKRCRRGVDLHHHQVGESPPPGRDSVSSSVVTESFTDEDAAMVLLNLLKDKWTREVKKKKQVIVVEQEVDYNNESREEEDEDEEEEDDSLNYASRARNNKKPQAGKYRCDTCNKEFRSYQALGGHRASHKNKRIRIEPEEEEEEEEYDDDDEEEEVEGGGGAGPSIVVDQRVFECPFCDKVFQSGQALGGHKKVHFYYLTPASQKNKTHKSGDNLLDLNLPAPEDDGEVSYQVEHSTVLQ